MKCSRCGAAVVAGWVACPQCGAPLVVPGPARPASAPLAAGALPQAFVDQRKKNARTATIIGIVLLAAILLLGLTKGLQALGFGSKPTDTRSLSVQAKMPENILGVTAPQAPPVLTAGATPPAQMPKDVYDWLEHLRKTEEARVGLTTTQLSKAMTEYAKSQAFGGVDSIKDLLNGIDDPNHEMKTPTDELYPVLMELHDQSKDLIGKFDSYPPPAECQPIHDAYYEALSETTGMLGDIADNLKSGDVDKLLNMKGTSPGQIDANANKADRLVGEICDKYNTRRWFYIKGDIGSDGVMGMPKL